MTLPSVSRSPLPGIVVSGTPGFGKVLTVTGDGTAAWATPGYDGLVRATPGLIADLLLNEASGSVLVDELGNNGTYTASPTLGVAGPLAGLSNKGVTFNGTTQYGLIPTAPILHPGDVWSVQFWFKRSAIGALMFPFLLNGDFSIQFSVANLLILQKGGAGNWWFSSSAITDTTAWHHLVVIKNGATTTVYLDGVAFAGSLSNLTLTAGSGDLYIAGYGSDGFAGSMSRIQMFNRPLTVAEVAAFYGYHA